MLLDKTSKHTPSLFLNYWSVLREKGRCQLFDLKTLISKVLIYMFKKYKLGAGKMAQWLRAFAALAEDQDSDISTYIVAQNHL